MQSVLESARALRAALASYSVDDYTGEDCAALVEELARIEKIIAATRVRAAAKAAARGMHRERGFAKASDWMARATGSTAGAADTELATVAALEAQPEVRAALHAGELSLAQARELVRIEGDVPGSAIELLGVAKTSSLRVLKDKARPVPGHQPGDEGPPARQVRCG